MKVFRSFCPGCLIFSVHFVPEGRGPGIKGCRKVFRIVAFKKCPEILKEDYYGIDVFSVFICKGMIYQCKVCPVNKAVTVKNINAIITHRAILVKKPSFVSENAGVKKKTA